MGAPRLDTSVDVVALFDLEALGIMRRAVVTVLKAVLTVYFWVDLGKKLADGRTAAFANGKFLGAVDERLEHLPPELGNPLSPRSSSVAPVSYVSFTRIGEGGFVLVA